MTSDELVLRLLHSLEQQKKPKRGWAQSVTLQTLSGNQQSMQAHFPEEDVYTVQFSLLPKSAPAIVGRQPASNVPLNPIQCTATLLWDIAGNHLQRQVTVGNGVSISGTAGGVTVKVKDTTQGGYGGGPNQIMDYDVTIAISRGVRGPSGRPPTLDLVNNTPNAAWLVTAAAGHVDVPIPPNTGAISVAVEGAASTAPTSLPDSAILVAQLVNGNVFKIYDPRWFGEYVPLIPNCDTIRLINQTTALAQTPETVAFAVSLGIDG